MQTYACGKQGYYAGVSLNIREVDLVKRARLVQEEYYNLKYAGNYSEDMEEGTPPVRRTSRAQISQTDHLTKGVPAPNSTELFVSGRNAPLRASFVCLETEEASEGFSEKDSSILLTMPSKKTKSKADLDRQIGKKEITEFVAQMIDRHIPCLLIAPAQPTVKLTIFFHANAEDIGQAYDFCKSLNQKLDVPQSDQTYFLLVEYPGYGIYPGSAAEEDILSDLEPVWLFVTKVMNFQPKDVLVMGRSIGSGPACHFATSFDCGALALVSPFLSIKAVAQHNFGSLAAKLLTQRFDNISKIDKIRCPCLFIHGKEDSLIPYTHSKELYSTLRSPDKCTQPAEVLIFSGMTHQYFDLTECVAMPTVKFLEKVQPEWIRPDVKIRIPHFIFTVPDTAVTTGHLHSLSKKYCDWKDCEMSPEQGGA